MRCVKVEGLLPLKPSCTVPVVEEYESRTGVVVQSHFLTESQHLEVTTNDLSQQIVLEAFNYFHVALVTQIYIVVSHVFKLV